MPIYEYKCKKCGRRFEKLQSIHDHPLEKCIFCQGTVEKLISASSFTFKGSGWYLTDYKKKKPAPKKETVGKESAKN